MTSFVIESSTTWLGNLLVDQVKFLAKVRGKVEVLQRELKWMSSFLSDADRKQYKDNLVRQWISEIKDLAQDAEDVIERYILKVSRKREKPRGLIPWSDLKWLLCCLKDATTLHGVGNEFDTIVAQIHELTRRLETYGVHSSPDKRCSLHPEAERKLIEQRRTYSHVEDNVVVGLNEQVKEVADKLVEGQIKVVVIHGMGGIGKTTLGREVYHHAPLKSHFVGGIAWAYVSQQLQLESLCRDVLLQLIPRNCAEEGRSVQELHDSPLLIGKLFDVLKSTACLVVLDDIWSPNDWNRLQHAFPLNHHSCGSKLVVTTRKPHIFSGHPSYMAHYHETKILNYDTSWELFQKRACFAKESAEPPKVELAEKMLKHCDGHPLAISVLGGVLATKETLTEWKDVYGNLGSNLQGDGEYSGVYEVLALSYYDLPYHLKACFLILGYFPEDFEIPAKRLYHLWIAEGIVSSTRDRGGGKQSLEDIAKAHLNELALRGMVQLTRLPTKEWYEGSPGPEAIMGREACRVHDLMRDKCLELVEQENFLGIVGQSHSSQLNDKLRRVAIHLRSSSAGLLSSSPKVSCLRSLLFFDRSLQSTGWMDGIFNNFLLLRTLDFTGLDGLAGKLPGDIGSLIHLRYLSLNGTGIDELPDGIGNLRSLLILDLLVQGRIKIPNVVGKIQSLRQLYLPLAQITGDKLTLYNLRNIEIIEGLELDRVDVEGLEELRSLQKLSAYCWRNEEALRSFLRSESIKRMCIGISSSIFVGLSDVLRGCHFLVYLSIYSGDVQLPATSAKIIPQNLQALVIYISKISEEWISTLEKLPHLKELELVDCYEGSKLHISSNGFPELSYLYINGAECLIAWTVKRNGLPKLKRVHLDNCPIQLMIPQDLPQQLTIKCDPCVRGIERYGGCGRWFPTNCGPCIS